MFILATREDLSWHFDYIDKYLRMKYHVIDSIHTGGNSDKKSNSKSQFFFGDITEELKVELKEFGFDVMVKDKKMKLR